MRGLGVNGCISDLHSEGRRFDPVRLHVNTYKLVVMYGDRTIMIRDWNWRYKLVTRHTGRMYLEREQGDDELLGDVDDIDSIHITNKVDYKAK